MKHLHRSHLPHPASLHPCIPAHLPRDLPGQHIIALLEGGVLLVRGCCVLPGAVGIIFPVKGEVLSRPERGQGTMRPSASPTHSQAAGWGPLTCSRMGAEAGSHCLSPHPRGRCSYRSEARLFTHWTLDGGREGEAGMAVPLEWGRGWGVSYLPRTVQPVRDFQELSLCPGANVTAIPFQRNTVDHHETAERQEVKPWHWRYLRAPVLWDPEAAPHREEIPVLLHCACRCRRC